MANTGKRAFSLMAATLALVVLAMGPARAETIMPNTTSIDPDSLFLQFLRSEGAATDIARRSAIYDRAMGITCNENYRVGVEFVNILRPVVTVPEGPLFAGEDIPQPTGGLWMARYDLNRCGEDIKYSYLGRVGDGGQLIIQALVAGQTNLNPLFITGVKNILSRQSGIENCERQVISDTVSGTPDGYDPENDNLAYETWAITGCGQTVQVIFRLEMDAQQGVLRPVVERRTSLN